ncbi:hypothetical protein C8Q77DRAFT_1157997 [Trametes polyzona]|nr:hypothetical protein C8Q77DRAFT_1157997 [Trametes polyzona]
MIIPGPKESDSDQTQGFLRVLVNELIRLWRDGVILPTHSRPGGRRIRVILVGVFCDKPAAHKIGGFGSHNHTFFCTRDWISQGRKALREAFERHGFRERTDRHHRLLMAQYKDATSANAREEHASAFATRWSELARLPYFHFPRMIVVDPMHNLFLGLVKTHFYHIWVQLKVFRKAHEIREVQEILSNVSLPSRLGRLPRFIGEPAGGSLTADQWLILATVVGPLALPELWEGVPISTRDSAGVEIRDTEFLETRIETLRKRVARRKASAQKARKKRMATAEDVSESALPAPRRSARPRKPTEKGRNLVLDEDDAGAELDSEDGEWSEDEDNNDEADGEDSSQRSNLHIRDLCTFLKLCTALRLFLSDVITEEQLSRADTLIREYCQEIVELYGADVIRPNHHYATHTAEFVRDYGPLRGFWTFIFERLNKILKSYRTNNHEGGEIEATFFREFNRSARLNEILSEGLALAPDDLFHRTCSLMEEATSDRRGTLQQLVQDLADERADDNVVLSFSPRATRTAMSKTLYTAFLRYMQTRYPFEGYHSYVALAPRPGAPALANVATMFDYVVIAGNRYYAANRSAKRMNSLALIRTSSAGDLRVGLLEDIVLYDALDTSRRQYFVHVRWLRHAPITLEGTPWIHVPPTFKLQLWEVDQYLDPLAEPGPTPIVQLCDVLSPVASYVATIHGRRTLITMPISRGPIAFPGAEGAD